MREQDGYVIYYKSINRNIPLGVVSDNHDCKALSNYIPKYLKNYLIEIEDRRFYEHKGIDLIGISRALIENIKSGRIIQGGSTITQQLARNLLKDNTKTLLRKFKETIKAFQIENQYSKDEILNLYFNNVYFGKNIWGIRAAGLHYFSKEVERLNQTDFLYLLTILRGPNYYSIRPKIIIDRYKTINNILFKKKQLSESRFKKNLKADFKLNETHLSNIKNVSIPFIVDNIDIKKKKVNSTIELRFQNFSKQFVNESKYPVSIIVIKQGKVIGFASSYGTDYPFISKTNVGSTLKPFLYCYLRSKGISKIEEFNSCGNNLSWNVREVGYRKSQFNIQEALFYSNNNTFLNASCKVGIESCLEFLATIFNKPKGDFFPSSILGSTKCGISLYELALAYSSFFNHKYLTDNKSECLLILNKIFYEKLDFKLENAFLKTGTTNDNKERYAVLGNADLTYAILRNENEINDESKEGSFMNQISRNISLMFKKNMDFEWI